MSIREIAQNFRNFCPKYIPLSAFRVFSLLLPKFFYCICQNFQLLLPEFREKAMGSSGKSNGNSGKSNGKIWAKAMRKLGKRRHIFRAKFIPFARISHCFFLKFLLRLPEFSITHFRISNCFCPNFPLQLSPEFPTAFARIFRFQKLGGGGGGWGAQCPPAPPPPPRLLRLWLLIRVRI